MPNKKENKLVLYKDDEGKLSVNTLFADEDVWLTQAQLDNKEDKSKTYFVQVPQILCIKVLEFGGFLVPLH